LAIESGESIPKHSCIHCSLFKNILITVKEEDSGDERQRRASERSSLINIHSTKQKQRIIQTVTNEQLWAAYQVKNHHPKMISTGTTKTAQQKYTHTKTCCFKQHARTAGSAKGFAVFHQNPS